jgi:hypothetical protein
LVVELMFTFTLLAFRCVNIFYCKRGKDVETFRRWTALDSNEKEISHGMVVAISLMLLRNGGVRFIEWLDLGFVRITHLASRMRIR